MPFYTPKLLVRGWPPPGNGHRPHRAVADKAIHNWPPHPTLRLSRMLVPLVFADSLLWLLSVLFSAFSPTAGLTWMSAPTPQNASLYLPCFIAFLRAFTTLHAVALLDYFLSICVTPL